MLDGIWTKNGKIANRLPKNGQILSHSLALPQYFYSWFERMDAYNYWDANGVHVIIFHKTSECINLLGPQRRRYIKKTAMCRTYVASSTEMWYHSEQYCMGYCAHGRLQFCRLQKPWHAWCPLYHHIFAAPTWLLPRPVCPFCPLSLCQQAQRNYLSPVQ